MLVVTHFILTLLFFVTAMSPVPSEECNALAGLYRNKGMKKVITILDGLGRRWRKRKLYVDFGMSSSATLLRRKNLECFISNILKAFAS